MIKSLSDAVWQSIREAAGKPEAKDLRGPGLSDMETRKLERILPSLPRSYMSVAVQIPLMGRSIGYFLLWPGGKPEGDLLDRLVEVNSDENPRWGDYVANGVLEVGRYEAEPLCVATKGSRWAAGTMFIFSLAEPIYQYVPLAPNFETLVVLAAGVLELENRSSEISVNDFLANTSYFALDEGMREQWRRIAEIAVS